MQDFIYYTIDPPPALKHYVRSYWVFKGNGNAASPYVYRSMADPCAELVFHYRGTFKGLDELENEIPGTDAIAVLHGPAKTFKRYRTYEDFAIFGAYLYPFAIPDLFDFSCDEIRNGMPTIADCTGIDGRSLTEQIMNADDNNSRAAILSRFLLQQLGSRKQNDLAIHACIKHMLHEPSPVRIDKIVSAFNIPERQLQRKFKTITGFAPKTYARLTRFQQVLNRYGDDFKSLTDLAYECGYFDQSHFIHDFKEFSGYEPGTYFAGKGEGIEYREA